ncbi:MAG: nucleotidyltransferase domain-containing protein [Planctomycetes bacterium]|nr:nucleotidyltransferase domain-containing protein [Planctomycetota bacterium]
MVTTGQIQDFARQIADVFRVERIILFGSHADGTPTEDSDVDLLVVASHEGRSWEHAAAIRSRLRPGFPVDLMVRSPEELRARLDMGDDFFREITEHGKPLYEAKHG